MLSRPHEKLVKGRVAKSWYYRLLISKGSTFAAFPAIGRRGALTRLKPLRKRLGPVPHRASTGAKMVASLPMVKTPDTPTSFEAALAELEGIVATMEGGKLPLAESLSAYRRGVALLEFCQATLKDAQQQVQVLEKGVLKGFVPADAENAGSDES